MYFKTLKTSETGLKLALVEEKIKQVNQATSEALNKYGSEQCYRDRWAVCGGIEAVVFKQEPDMKIWKKFADTRDGYSPRINSKQGKEIKKEFDALPRVSKGDLNSCIGDKEELFHSIGVVFNKPDFYLITVEEEWNLTMPSDCEEITTSEYKKLNE